MMASAAVIETRELTKDYGAGRGLFDLDLEVQSGEVFGFLGPNGAGKTTTIRLLMGTIFPTRGHATIFGLDCHRQAVAVKQRVSFVPGELPQFGGLRGGEIVTYLGSLRGHVDARRVATVAERLGLDLSRRYREYSRGNKQQLALVLAFMHCADLLILDEPTSGLDPLNQQTFYGLVREARAGGATVFLSSHILSEVEHICDRVGIVRQGHLVAVSGLAELRRKRLYQVKIQFAGPPPEAAVRAARGVEHVQVSGNHLTCTVRESFEPLLAAIAGRGVLTLTSEEPSLEDLFLSYYRDTRDGMSGGATGHDGSVTAQQAAGTGR